MSKAIALTMIFLFTFTVPLLAQDEAVPRFEPSDCPVEIPEGAVVDCGDLIVPENRSDPDSGTIRVAVAIIHSHSPNPEPDPMLFTPGGPGNSAFDILDRFTQSLHLAHRNYILVEQRGTFYSEPSLSCPEVQGAQFENYTVVEDRITEIEREVQAASACRDRLLADGVDLSAYNSVESAADLEDLRAVLGIEQYNYVGTSYGARLAQTVMRLYPDSLRSVVLDSVFTTTDHPQAAAVPTLADALNTLFDQCAADAECSAAYPDFEARFYAVIERLNAAPQPVTILNPFTDGPAALLLTGDDVLQGVFNALYDRSLIEVIPFLIEELYAGNIEVTEPLAQSSFEGLDAANIGMTYSVTCNEEFPFDDLEAVRQAASAHPRLANFLPSLSEYAVCEIWPSGTADPIEDEPVTSDIPALVFAGNYDPITSPRLTQAFAAGLSNAYFYLFPDAGHSAQDHYLCARQMAAAFVIDPTQAPDAGCIAEIAPINVITAPQDIYPTPALYRLNRDVIEAQNLAQIGLLGFCLVVFVVQIVVLIVSVVGWRTGSIQMRWGRGIAGLAALIAILNLIFVALFVDMLFNTDEIILGFGLPSSFIPVLYLPIIAAVLTVVLVVMLVLAWREETRTRARVLYYTVFTLAAIAFTVWLNSAGLLTLLI